MRRGTVFAGRVATAAALALVPAARAQERASPALPTALPAGTLDDGLRRLAAAAGEQLLIDPALVHDRRAPAIPAGTPVARALERMLAPYGLAATRAGPGVLVVTARASASAASPPEAPAQPLDPDIVVTALRRPTLLGDTAASVAVVSARMLERQRVPDQRSLRRLLPGLVQVAGGALQQRLGVRGVLGTGEGTVGVYVGDTPVSAPAGTGLDPGGTAPDLDLIDVERVELLSGPQGTLYGASSMGGTLRTLYRRADPGRASGEAMVEGGATTDGAPSAAAAAILNVPLVPDRLAVRAVVGRRRTGGTIDNVRLGVRDVDRVTRGSERLSLAWTPSDAVRVDAMLLEQRNAVGSTGVAFARVGPLLTDAAVLTPNDDRLTLASATLAWSPGGLRLVATASRYRWRIARQIDYSVVIAGQRDSDAACLRFAAWEGGAACDAGTRARFRAYVDTRLPSLLYQPMTVTSSIGELRLSDAGGGALVWTAGLFAERRRDRVASYAVRADAASGRIVTPLDVTGLRLVDTALDQQAAYAEGTWTLGGGLSATGGGRFYRYVRGAGGSVPVPNPITGTAALGPGHYRVVETGGNGKAQVTWRRGDGRILVYALAAEGFRPGGVNITPDLTEAERRFRADHLWSYELGLKLPRLGARAGLDASLFHIDWDDTVFAASSANGAFLYNTNLASVAIDGAELRAGAGVGGVSLTGSVAWIDARLAEDTIVGTSDGAGRRGEPIPNVPRIAATATAEVKAGRASLGGLVSATGATRSAFAASRYRERTGPRAVVDLYVAWSAGGWSARLGMDNLLATAAPIRVASSAFGSGQIVPARPRTATLTLTRGF